jgi:hypothetical protein
LAATRWCYHLAVLKNDLSPADREPENRQPPSLTTPRRIECGPGRQMDDVDRRVAIGDAVLQGGGIALLLAAGQRQDDR